MDGKERLEEIHCPVPSEALPLSRLSFLPDPGIVSTEEEAADMAANRPQRSEFESADFSRPHETREFPKGKVELLTLRGLTFGRVTFEPGWRWSAHVKPLAGTSSCRAAHLGVQLSGTMHIKMDDGTEGDIGPGQVVNIPPGHDGWVVGNEPVVFIDITGMENYAKRSRQR
jgi:quercetin dioxygenase-like cupin family protein